MRPPSVDELRTLQEQHSPVAPFFARPLPALLALAAPGKADEVTRLLEAHRVRFLPVATPGFTFTARVSGDDRIISLSLRGVELLWALSYALLVLRSLHVTLTRAAAAPGPLVLAEAEFRAAERAVSVLGHAVAGVTLPLSAGRLWPPGLPQPELTPPPPDAPATPEREADALTAYALAWILHHELAHIVLGHPVVTTNSRGEEREADRAATTWLLDDPAATPLQRRSRVHGIALACLTLAILELAAGPRGPGPAPTHPPAAERLFAALDHPAVRDDDDVFDFVQLGLRQYARFVGDDLPPPRAATKREAAGECCVWLLNRLR